MTPEDRQAILDKINANIASHGFHVHVVVGGPSPRFAYTIGLRERLGFEVVLAGASFYTLREASGIVNEIVCSLRTVAKAYSPLIVLPELGSFLLREIHLSWSRKILLGAMNYYGNEQVTAVQIVPDHNHWTSDTPNMAELFNPLSEPAWKWLDVSWELPVSPQSVAVTNLDALRGHPVTEVMRWEEDEWEMFSGPGPDVKKNDIRSLPLATLVAQDTTLECVTSLPVGSGLWREKENGEWYPWGKK